MKKRVLSGIRATGRLHLGNYLGAVKGMLQLQDDSEYETYYMVADVHTITTPYSVEELRKNRREIIIDYLAAGLDPEKSVIFQQADINEHIELAFYFSSVTTIAKMQHLPTFKDKVKQYPENATMALLNYPLLMSADILVYKASLVPVGLDQEPHLEVSREIVRRMNQDYGTDFPEPQRFATKGQYIPSLTGDGKMSKSVEGSFINITDDLETIKSKIAKIATDTGSGDIKEINGIKTYWPQSVPVENAEFQNPDYSGVRTLMTFVELFEGSERREELEKQYQTAEGLRYGDIKKQLSEAIFYEFKPTQEKRKELENNPEYVDKVIREGAEKARLVAAQTVKEVKEKMGLG
jgi:tryptophanyl-tRNA synthetase